MDSNAALSLFEFDLDADPHDPPTNEAGEYICGRECLDGSRCLNRAPFPFLPCSNHDVDDPLL